MRCGWYTVKGKKWWIPGCEGAAIYGDYACTCYKPKVAKKTKSERLEDQYRELEDECRKLKALLESSQKKLHVAHRKVQEMERQGLPIHIRRRLNEPAYLKVFIDKITYSHG